MLSALSARLRTDDTQAYIRFECKGDNPVSTLGVGGNGLREKKIIVAHTLKWLSGLVCLATFFLCIVDHDTTGIESITVDVTGHIKDI